MTKQALGLRRDRGAAMVEYALLLLAVFLASLVAIKFLGPHVNTIGLMAALRLS